MREFCCFILCLVFTSSIYSQDTYTSESYALISDEEIKSRLATIHNDVVKPRFDPAVRSYVNTYTVKKRDRTEAMLGRTVIYYPLFEKLLAESGLPTDLKYLSVVESALNANAVSRSGAVGLWQFMKPTGRECGLSINQTVDERQDPEKATRAAIKYLSRQYHKYGNWELALAAYNGGPGRVNRAIKRGRSKNFWRIRRHLPRETRNYVPAFIAATYINHFYEYHGLNPIYPDVDFQQTQLIKIYSTLTFSEIEEVTGTPEYIIEYLNPSYKKKYIPANAMGNNLVLPQDRMAVFQNAYPGLDSRNRNLVVGERILAPRKKAFAPENSISLFHTVEQGENIQSLAQIFSCNESDIKKWNRLTSSQLRQGQRILIFISKDVTKSIALIEPLPLVKGELSSIQATKELEWKPIPLPTTNTKKSKKKRRKRKRTKYVYHKIKRGESLMNIAAKYQGVSVNDLIQLNNIDSGESLKPGKKLKVKPK